MKMPVKKKTEIQELSEFIRDHMVTKEYLDERLEPIYRTLETHTQVLERHTQILEGYIVTLSGLEAEVKDVRKQLEDLQERGASNAGFAKEIDYGFKRLAAIETHLGMQSPKRD